MGALRWRGAGHGVLLAVCAMPCGNAMPPPQLARDAPVIDVVHPVQVDGLVIVRCEADVALLNDFNSTLRERRDFHEPLRGKPRLDDRLAPVALADGHGVIFHMSK